ncbi:MAG: hypothetical protein Q9177_003215 [Variospora cf. flavescens]
MIPQSITRSFHPLKLAAQSAHPKPKAPMHTLSIAKGQDEKEILEYLEPLVRDTGGRWSIIQSGKGIHADFHFKSFKQTWVSAIQHLILPKYRRPLGQFTDKKGATKDFMSTVAAQCEVEKHHPEWSNVGSTYSFDQKSCADSVETRQ